MLQCNHKHQHFHYYCMKITIRPSERGIAVYFTRNLGHLQVIDIQYSGRFLSCMQSYHTLSLPTVAISIITRSQPCEFSGICCDLLQQILLQLPRINSSTKDVPIHVFPVIFSYFPIEMTNKLTYLKQQDKTLTKTCI